MLFIIIYHFLDGKKAKESKKGNFFHNSLDTQVEEDLPKQLISHNHNHNKFYSTSSIPSLLESERNERKEYFKGIFISFLFCEL